MVESKPDQGEITVNVVVDNPNQVPVKVNIIQGESIADSQIITKEIPPANKKATENKVDPEVLKSK